MIPEYNEIKQKYGHIFDIDPEIGNMTLKKGFTKNGREIPQFTMIFVRGGEFIMGDGSEAHKVIVSSFFIGQVPVIQELYEAVMRENPSDFKGKTRPVEQVSWYESINFCQELNKILDLPNNVSGEGDDIKIDIRKNSFRLPTEAEWEYAARGGQKGIKDNFAFSGSNDVNLVAWYDENNEYETKPVALKLPNQLGIYDMSGNVWEWCIDVYVENFYSKYKVNKNPCIQQKGIRRIVRGGAWIVYAISTRVAMRGDGDSRHIWYSGGFRLVLPF